AVASEAAGFATPGVKIGLFCSTPMVAVARNVGGKRAMWMLLTGEMIDARTAEAWGLVNEVVPAGRLETATRELARRVTAASSHTVAIGKRAFYDQIERSEHDAYERMAEVMVESALTGDAQEGICAFLEKRSPEWSDR
ncbi:MAG: enoyl-CoA hydratase-related protein, partial [Dehalococcoidia bacterium]